MNLNEITVQIADLSCVDDICEIENLCFSLPWSKQSITDFITNTDSVCFVAKHKEKSVGYIGMYLISGEGEITNVAVLPNNRNCGIASLLIKKIICFSVQNNLTKIMLEVRQSNISAISLYLKYGFEQVGIRKNYYIKPKENAILMDKNLSIAE